MYPKLVFAGEVNIEVLDGEIVYGVRRLVLFNACDSTVLSCSGDHQGAYAQSGSNL
jgi:hypothetical protein